MHPGEFEEIRPIDEVLLNPLTAIVKSHAENLYQHPLVKSYVFMRIRKDCTHIMLYLNLIFFAALVICLTGFAFTLPSLGSDLHNYNMTSFVTTVDKGLCAVGTTCFDWRIASTIFASIRFLSLLFDKIFLVRKYFDQSYFINDQNLTAFVHVGITLTYIWTLNPYFGVFCLFQSWLYLPSQLIRLCGGQNIIIMQRVFTTAFSIFHILIIFVGAIGSVFHILHGRFDSFRPARVVPKTMAVITGEFDIDSLLSDGTEILGPGEALYIIILVFVVFCCNIVLMNVFTGLAVGDVEEVKQEAEKIKAVFQMKMVANYRGARQLMKWSHSKAVTHKIDIVEEDYFYRNKFEKIRKLYRKHISVSADSYTITRASLTQWINEKGEASRPKEEEKIDKVMGRISLVEHRLDKMLELLENLTTEATSRPRS